MKTTQRLFILCLVALLIAGFCIPAAADESSTGSKNWEFALAPLYIWGVNMDGEMTLKDRTQSLQLDFDQIFDNLEVIFTFHFEGLYKKK
jgi:hypothetical protein